MENNKINKSVFPERLKELMKEHNESTYSLGDRLHLSAATISRYTSGEISPKITTIQVIAMHYNLNSAWLMGNNAPKYIDHYTVKETKSEYGFKTIKTHNLNEEFTEEEIEEIERFKQFIKMRRGDKNE